MFSHYLKSVSVTLCSLMIFLPASFFKSLAVFDKTDSLSSCEVSLLEAFGSFNFLVALSPVSVFCRCESSTCSIIVNDRSVAFCVSKGTPDCRRMLSSICLLRIEANFELSLRTWFRFTIIGWAGLISKV